MFFQSVETGDELLLWKFFWFKLCVFARAGVCFRGGRGVYLFKVPGKVG